MEEENESTDMMKKVAKAAKWVVVIGPILFFIMVALILVIAMTSTSQDSCFVDDTPTGKSGGGVQGEWSNKNSKAHADMAYAIKNFKQLGMSGDNIAAALAEGNRESNFNPKAYNPGGQVKGVWQWSAGGINGNRYGNTEDTMESQMALAMRELKGPYRVTLLAMKGADVDHSVSAWATHFEGLPVGDEVQRKHSQTVATAKLIKKEFNLNFSGNIQAGNNTIGGNNDGATSGAMNDLSSCTSNNNGTASGLPVQGKYNVTGGYPNYQGASGSEHYGVDFQSVNHDGEAGNVYAVADGKVVSKSFDPIGGNHVAIKTTDGMYTYYGHAPTLNAIVVNVGDKVKKGQHISHQGQTGLATGVHVHFGLNKSQPVFGPGSKGITSPGNYLKKLPRSVVPNDKTVVPGGVFNAK